MSTETATLYDVTLHYSESPAGKWRTLGSHICVARDEEDARDQAKAELWGAPFEAGGLTPHFDIRALPRYLVCEAWGHFFTDVREVTTRWTMNRATGELVDADVLGGSTGSKWVALDRADRADLLESLRDNEVEACPSDFDVEELDVLPAWSASKP